MPNRSGKGDPGDTLDDKIPGEEVRSFHLTGARDWCLSDSMLIKEKYEVSSHYQHKFGTSCGSGRGVKRREKKKKGKQTPLAFHRHKSVPDATNLVSIEK